MKILACKILIAGLILLVTLASAQECQRGAIRIDKNCVDCKTLQHVRIDDVEFFSADNRCPCKQGYIWSNALLRCVSQPTTTRNILSAKQEGDSETQISRMLQTSTCPPEFGFIAFGRSGVCVNCRLLPFASGVTINSTSCACAPSFSWSRSNSRCQCGSRKFIDMRNGECQPCSSVVQSLFSACNACSFPFISGRNGCVSCSSLANNGGNASCCATGYVFDPLTSSCVCDSNRGFSVNANNVCSRCPTGDINCINCVGSYVSNGIQCLHASLVSQYDPSNSRCSTGTVLKYNPVLGNLLYCACSASAGFFKNVTSSTCISCTVAFNAGAAQTNCRNCAVGSGYYRGDVDCVDCRTDPNSLNSATASGCNCKANYYWNSNNGRCECDFTLGFIGGGNTSCLNCANISNTGPTIIPDSCSCLIGYVWNPSTSRCDCDIRNPGVFVKGVNCISCGSMQGSTGVVSNSTCVCLPSYFWNPGSNLCECDASQNYAVFPTGFCTDCALAPLATGLGFGSGCVCQNSYIWNETTKACVCPASYALFGTICRLCASADAAAIANPMQCSSCDSAGNFALQNGVCAYCPLQTGTINNGTVLNGACQCPAGQVWNAALGSCICNWGNGNKNNGGGWVTASTTGSTFTCNLCPYFWRDGSCACGFAYYYLSSTGICSDCTVDPNAEINSRGSCVCKTGFAWSETSYPFKCTRTFSSGFFLGSNGTVACSSLSTNLAAACLVCDQSQGFVLAAGINTCVYCGAITGATGTALLNGCQCNNTINGTWNPFSLSCDLVNDTSNCTIGYLYNPGNGTCDICDPVKSANNGSSCIFCASVNNSLGYSVSSGSACACQPTFNWTGFDCSNNATCDTTTSIWIDGSCFLCPSSGNGLGAPDAANSSICGCATNFTWVSDATGGYCSCPVNFYLVNETSCNICPNDTNATGLTGSTPGVCQCNNNYVWNNTLGICMCDVSINAIFLPSGQCFVCDPNIDYRFEGAATNVSCRCADGFTFVLNGADSECVCGGTSVLVNDICVTCPITSFSTGSPDGNGGCVCINNYVWNATQNDCVCDASVSGIVTSNGCFLCLNTTDPNFDGTLNGSVCNCINGWVFTPNANGGSCNCPSNKYLFNGTCNSCPSTANTTGSTDGSNGCACQNGYVWSNTVVDCLCDGTVGAVLINNNASCFQCVVSNTTYFDGTVTSGACNCLPGFTAGIDSNGQPTCTCADPLILSLSGTCFSCPLNTSSGPDQVNKVCRCNNGFTWDSVNLACVCNPLTSILTSNGTCFTCGQQGSYTRSRRNSRSCTCINSQLSWNADALRCDCGRRSALIVNGTTFNCAPCSSRNNAITKRDSFSCVCVSNVITWNPATGRCDCGATGFYLNNGQNNTCIYCDASRLASGVSNNRAACTCRFSFMTWNRDTLNCVCPGNTVLFNVSGNVTCQACGPTIFSQNTRANPTTCNCFNNSVWVLNVGCACTGYDAIPILNNNRITCTVCSAAIYSSGPAANLRGCICLGSLTWSASTLRCGCPNNNVIAIANGQFFCTPCITSNNARLPIINGTRCTCTSSNLTWYNQGFCGCSDPNTQVVGSTGSCITCDSTIYAIGKPSLNSTVCQCIDPILTFNNGICDCGTTSAIVTSGLQSIFCVVCNNATAFLASKRSATVCNCVSPNLVWNPASAACICANSTQIIVVSGSSYTCRDCLGRYTVAPNGLTTCSCQGTGLVFTPSSTGGACACPAGNILLSNFSCFRCPNTTSTVSTTYECRCNNANSIWNTYLLRCQVCGGAEIPNSISGGGSFLTCRCRTGFIWDVVTQSCITTCAANNSTCLACNYYAETTGSAFALNSSNSRTLTGSSTVQQALNFAYTNFGTLRNFQCGCISGQIWDPIRLRCFDINLV